MKYWPGTNIVKSENSPFTAHVNRTSPSIMWSQAEEVRAKKLIQAVDGITVAERKKQMLAVRVHNSKSILSGSTPKDVGQI